MKNARFLTCLYFVVPSLDPRLNKCGLSGFAHIFLILTKTKIMQENKHNAFSSRIGESGAGPFFRRKNKSDSTRQSLSPEDGMSCRKSNSTPCVGLRLNHRSRGSATSFPSCSAFAGRCSDIAHFCSGQRSHPDVSLFIFHPAA